MFWAHAEKSFCSAHTFLLSSHRWYIFLIKFAGFWAYTRFLHCYAHKKALSDFLISKIVGVATKFSSIRPKHSPSIIPLWLLPQHNATPQKKIPGTHHNIENTSILWQVPGHFQLHNGKGNIC